MEPGKLRQTHDARGLFAHAKEISVIVTCNHQGLRSSDRPKQPWKLTWCAGSRAVRGNAGSAVNELPNEHGIIQPLGTVETVMEASLCPMCSRALKISTIEPHPTRDGVDVVTRRCPIHGDIWRSVVVNKVEAADTGHRDAFAATTR